MSPTELVKLWRAENNGAAVSTLVVIDGRKVFAYSAGQDFSPRRNEITLDTPMKVGSVTKVVTAFLAERAEESKRIPLRDSIGQVLSRHCSSTNRLTLESLLTQTAGLVGTTVVSEEQSKLADVACVANQSQHLPWRYANANYILAGMLAEKLGGSSLAAQFVAAFSPVDPSRCYYYKGGEPRGAQAQRLPDIKRDELPYASGAGGLVCSIRALAVVGTTLGPWLNTRSGGWARLGDSTRYGHGMYRYEDDGAYMYLHDGEIDGSSTVLLLRPNSKTVIAIASPTRSDLTRLALALAAARF